MNVTKNLAAYTKSIGVNLSELSRKSGIPYSALYASIGDDRRERELRADEFTRICMVLHKNPMDFATDNGGGEPTPTK